MLLERFVAYLSQKKMPISQDHLCGLAIGAGYTRDEISTTLKALANHEYVLNEEWQTGKSTFKWVKDTVEYNRSI